MKPAPLPHDEEARLAALRELAILDTPPDELFDRLTRVAAAVLDVPIALVSLVDHDRQWFKSCVGLDVTETTRDLAFCAHAILADEVFVVPDATQDDRFADNPLVTGPPHIRAYAGAPLLRGGTTPIGTLCVIDQRPRTFDDAQLQLLRDLADVVVAALDQHARRTTRQRANEQRLEQQALLEGLVQAFPDIVLHRRDGRLEVLGGDPALGVVLETDLEQLEAAIAPTWTRDGDGASQAVVEFERHDGRVTVLEGRFGDAGGTQVAVLRDVTEVHRRWASLEAASVQVTESSAAKRGWFADISHELRTPLNALLGFTELLVDDAHGTAFERDVAELRASSLDVIHLVSEGLELAKLEAGRAPVDAGPVALDEVLPQPVARDLDVRVRGDVELLTDAFARLCGPLEARQAPPSVEVQRREGHVLVVLRYDDTLPDDVLEPFAVVSDEHGHLGLGLAVAAARVRAAGGQVDVLRDAIAVRLQAA